MEGYDKNKNRSLYTIHVSKTKTIKINDKSAVEDDECLHFELNRDENPKQNSAQATPSSASDSRKNNFLSMEQ